MTICNVCGNEYNQSFELHSEHEIQVFDRFECAFYTVTPMCACCKGKINENGIEIGGVFFCCIHCAVEYHACELKQVAYVYEAEPILYSLSAAYPQAF